MNNTYSPTKLTESFFEHANLDLLVEFFICLHLTILFKHANDASKITDFPCLLKTRKIKFVDDIREAMEKW